MAPTKLCQKCVDSMKEIAESNLNSDPDVVPETECELWVHVELRRISNLYEDQRERLHELGLALPDDPMML